jgi:hypothetical protein
VEPYLDREGRRAYKQGLVAILQNLLAIERGFNDDGRIGRIKRGIQETLVDINTIAMAKNEKQVWDDSKVGLRF